MEYAIVWFLFGLSAAIIANGKGRGGWFILGLLFGPFSLVVALLPSMAAIDQVKARSSGEHGEFKRCSFCAESVRKEAIKCKHCGSDIPGGSETEKEETPAEKTLAYKAGAAWAKIRKK